MEHCGLLLYTTLGIMETMKNTMAIAFHREPRVLWAL